MLEKILALLIAVLFGFKKTAVESLPLVSPSPTAVSTPTPKPLTFSQMNQLYGPCVYLPVLMYHHVQDPDAAKENHQLSISVATEIFRSQMQSLKNKGYQTVLPAEIINFFDTGSALAKKSLLLTFDDGYQDFYANALPILREFNLKAAVFLATGLVNNFGYLNWSEIAEASSYGISFGNHTWSHKSAAQNQGVVEEEISMADKQLAERGLNTIKIFAYPYGSINERTKKYLPTLGYKIAFATNPGSILCSKQRFSLPRIRVGNGSKFDF